MRRRSILTKARRLITTALDNARNATTQHANDASCEHTDAAGGRAALRVLPLDLAAGNCQQQQNLREVNRLRKFVLQGWHANAIRRRNRRCYTDYAGLPAG